MSCPLLLPKLTFRMRAPARGGKGCAPCPFLSCAAIFNEFPGRSRAIALPFSARLTRAVKLRGRAWLSEGRAALLAALQGFGPCRGFAPGGSETEGTGGQLLNSAPLAAGATVVVGMGVEETRKFEQQRGGGQTIRTDDSMIRHAAISLTRFVQRASAAMRMFTGNRQECLAGVQTDNGVVKARGPSAERPADGPSVA